MLKHLIFLLLIVSQIEAKVVLITGASQGIGRAAAEAFQERGWEVWAASRSANQHPKIHFLELDVTDADSVRNGVKKIVETSGRIDLLLNNAGYGVIGTEESIDIEQAKELFDVNFFGAVRMIQEVLPVMRAQKSGHIINISSTSGIRAIPALGLYAASKFALEGMTESLAANVSPWNIRVTLVVPGTVNNDWAKHCEVGTRPTDTQFYGDLTKRVQEKLQKLAPNGQPCSEIAALIVSLAEAEKCDLRVPTSEKVENVMRKKLIDPSGNALLQEQITFLETVMKE